MLLFVLLEVKGLTYTHTHKSQLQGEEKFNAEKLTAKSVLEVKKTRVTASNNKELSLNELNNINTKFNKQNSRAEFYGRVLSENSTGKIELKKEEKREYSIYRI